MLFSFSNLVEYLPNLRYVTPAFKGKYAITAMLKWNYSEFRCQVAKSDLVYCGFGKLMFDLL